MRNGWHTLPTVAEPRPVTEVHPGIDRFKDVQRVVDFLTYMPGLSDQERHAILMGALDTGVVSIPIDKLQLPNDAQRVPTRREIERIVDNTLVEVMLRPRGLPEFR